MPAPDSMRVFTLLPLLVLALLVACETAPRVTDQSAENLVLKPASFTALPGWQGDQHAAALHAFARSCARIATKAPADAFGPVGGIYGDWQSPCAALTPAVTATDASARQYLEHWFRPWAASSDGGTQEGLFTGYYEASLKGSRTRHGPYQTPLRKRPDDLVMVDLGLFRDSLKGQRIAGRVIGGDLKPYEDHRTIDQGKLPGDASLPLVWVDDPVKAFFLQIQGSGRIQLDDGATMSLGYAGQNGHVYYAVGRELVKRGALAKDQVNMQSIESWLKAHPDQAREIMYSNPSYVFFKEMNTNGAVGGENIVLTPQRSIAVDRSKIAYGIPVWVDIPDAPHGAIKQLMIAQDTGGAIRGPVRGDIFFGYGEQAEILAGPMKAPGKWWFLLPKTVTPALP